MMQKAAIDYHGGELEAWEYEDLWTVRLGELESSSRYLDLALAELLDDSEGVHTLAARLLAETSHSTRGDRSSGAGIRLDGPSVLEFGMHSPLPAARHAPRTSWPGA